MAIHVVNVHKEGPLPEPAAPKVVRIRIVDIEPEPIFQFRLSRNPRRLVASMREDGQQYPIHVQRKSARYRIIDGDQRRQAARLLGWEEIDAGVHDVDDRTALRLAYQLNEEHKSFTSLERLNFIERLAEEGYRNDEIAPIIGVKRADYVSRLRGSLPLSRRYWRLLRQGRLHPSSIAIIRRAPRKKWDHYVRRVIEEGLSARKLEAVVSPRRRDLLDDTPDGGFLFRTYRHDVARGENPDEVERHAEVFDRCGARLRAWARRRRRELRGR